LENFNGIVGEGRKERERERERGEVRITRKERELMGGPEKRWILRTKK